MNQDNNFIHIFILLLIENHYIFESYLFRNDWLHANIRMTVIFNHIFKKIQLFILCKKRTALSRFTDLREHSSSQ